MDIANQEAEENNAAQGEEENAAALVACIQADSATKHESSAQ